MLRLRDVNQMKIKSLPISCCVCLLILSSCVSIPCLDTDIELNEVFIQNLGSEWNCGLDTWRANQEEINEICHQMSQLVAISRVNVRARYWRLDVYFNGEQEDRFHNNFKLYSSENDGLVFRKGNRFYKNDALANYFILKLAIKNLKPGPCDTIRD